MLSRVLTAKSTYASISASVKDPVLVRSMLEAAARNIRNHNSIWTGDNRERRQPIHLRIMGPQHLY